jgi:hypothetical protein
MAFHNMQSENDKWVNLFLAMGKILWQFWGVIKASTPNCAYTQSFEHFLVIPPPKTYPIMACIMKQLGPKLLLDAWEGFNNLNIEQFGWMTQDIL